jgi:ABC-type glutathione transport system ATPase component
MEPLLVTGVSRSQAAARIRDLLDEVHLPGDAAQRLPREFSGGQRQRVAIARALSRSPRLLVCDEPVSALDLTNQQRVLDLFIEIQERTGVAYLFITHDLAVVRHISHRVAVMYHGAIVETGDSVHVTNEPDHPLHPSASARRARARPRTPGPTPPRTPTRSGVAGRPRDDGKPFGRPTENGVNLAVGRHLHDPLELRTKLPDMAEISLLM